MYDNYNYPPGADTADAPWNQAEIPEKDFDVTISQTLSRDAKVTTNDYIPGASGVDYDSDDEGGYCKVPWQDPDDTSNTDWNKVYKNCCKTPLQLMELFRECLESNMKQGIVFRTPAFTQQLIRDCQGWVEDDYCVNEN